MTVGEVMSTQVFICHQDDALTAPAGIMWEHDCGSVPVVAQDDHVVGMITDRDLCMAAYTKGLPLHGIRVSDAMSREVVACAPEDSLAEATEAMCSHQVRRLPVVEDGRIVGILSLKDLALLANRQGKKGKKMLTATKIADTLAAVSTRSPGETVRVAV